MGLLGRKTGLRVRRREAEAGSSEPDLALAGGSPQGVGSGVGLRSGDRGAWRRFLRLPASAARLDCEGRTVGFAVAGRAAASRGRHAHCQAAS